MNCIKGDLAMVTRVRQPKNRWMIGRVVRCKSFALAGEAEGWILESSLDEPDPGIFSWGWIADYCLRPIRNPGDDAGDESKAWLPPVPLPKIEPALLPTRETI